MSHYSDCYEQELLNSYNRTKARLNNLSAQFKSLYTLTCQNTSVLPYDDSIRYKINYLYPIEKQVFYAKKLGEGDKKIAYQSKYIETLIWAIDLLTELNKDLTAKKQ